MVIKYKWKFLPTYKNVDDSVTRFIGYYLFASIPQLRHGHVKDIIVFLVLKRILVKKYFSKSYHLQFTYIWYTKFVVKRMRFYITPFKDIAV